MCVVDTVDHHLFWMLLEGTPLDLHIRVLVTRVGWDHANLFWRTLESCCADWTLIWDIHGSTLGAGDACCLQIVQRRCWRFACHVKPHSSMLLLLLYPFSRLSFVLIFWCHYAIFSAFKWAVWCWIFRCQFRVLMVSPAQAFWMSLLSFSY